MKINYKNTAIGLLDNIDPRAFRICQDADHSPQEYKTALGLNIVSEFPKIADRFKQKIQYISDPFYQAYEKSVNKLGAVIDSEPINQSGTFISRSSPSETNTIFYDISSEGKGKDFKLTAVIFFFTKHTNNDKPSLAIYAQRNDHGTKLYLSETAHKNGCDAMSVIADIFTMLLFMRYCDLQTKEVKPLSKENHINCKYLNETNHKIEILDSTYFTTISRTEGFGVRGHFRWQHYGVGMKQKRLQWISDFVKQGYTKRAKIERDNLQ